MVKSHSFQFSEDLSISEFGTLSNPLLISTFWHVLIVSGKWTHSSYWTSKGMGKEDVRKMSRCSRKKFTGNFQSALEWGVLARYSAVEDIGSVQPQPPHWSYCLLGENEYIPGILPQPHLKCLGCFYSQYLSIRSRLTFPLFLGKKKKNLYYLETSIFHSTWLFCSHDSER